jgi:hypothetical protein
MNESSRIYYLSNRSYVKDYMVKTKFFRIFEMKSNTQKKFLPKKTQKAIEELIKYNCQINYTIK